MKYTAILKKGESVLLWIFKTITNKFTNIFKKLIEKFPVLNRYPLLRYSLIPLLIALFFLLRYIINLLISELATWTSSFVGETSAYSLSEGTIVLIFATVFIVLRILVIINKQKKKKSNEMELSYEKTK